MKRQLVRARVALVVTLAAVAAASAAWSIKHARDDQKYAGSTERCLVPHR